MKPTNIANIQPIAKSQAIFEQSITALFKNLNQNSYGSSNPPQK